MVTTISSYIRELRACAKGVAKVSNPGSELSQIKTVLKIKIITPYLLFVTGTTGGTRRRRRQICHVEKFDHMTDFHVDKFST